MSVIEFDNQRFDDLYQKYAGMIFRTAYNFLLNKDDAEDIVQEVFIKYFISNKSFKDNNHEKAWILTVTANLSKNVLRSKSRQNLELDDTMKIVDNTFEKAITEHSDLERAMKKLTADQRLVIYLFYYEQIPIKNIAKIMKSNENTVKSHLLRAKSKMKIYLEKEQYFMNYTEYNNQLKLPDDLYKKTLAGVQSEISKHNQMQREKKFAYLSFAACFMILVTSISSVKYFNNHSSDTFETTHNSSTNNKSFSTDNRTIKIKIEDTKYPQKIIMDNKIYSQYYFGDAKADKNNHIELKQSEIGDFVCTLDYFNLTNDLSNYVPMPVEEAKNNKFYNALVYKYAKSDNLIIVQTNNEYYIFYLNGLTTDYTIEDLLNLYTAKGDNEIIGIEIWQDEFYDYTIELPEGENITDRDIRPLLIGTITDKEVMTSIVNTIKECNENKMDDIDSYSSDDDKGLESEKSLMSDDGEYKLRLLFADGQALNLDKNALDITLTKDYFYFDICHKGNPIYYKIESSKYNRIVAFIASALS